MKLLPLLLCLACSSADTVKGYFAIYEGCKKLCEKYGGDPNVTLTDTNEVICLCKTRCAEAK